MVVSGSNVLKKRPKLIKRKASINGPSEQKPSFCQKGLLKFDVWILKNAKSFWQELIRRIALFFIQKNRIEWELVPFRKGGGTLFLRLTAALVAHDFAVFGYLPRSNCQVFSAYTYICQCQLFKIANMFTTFFTGHLIDTPFHFSSLPRIKCCCDWTHFCPRALKSFEKSNNMRKLRD